ncbi:protease HtpX [Clostridium tepidiprofundi DSM 19306]|uniref:Protease HtpX n=1 Tax=Clostridium tepidiprofundi DSM 19306 TaxID=1121338 RepID=A0A151B2B2_9CLOT|nr:M48 family metallopeptidase [Clostridium tepidiprofundi]KYH34044.1 protease HtpX [Clostridium tepidiprofundi DSM 19306]
MLDYLFNLSILQIILVNIILVAINFLFSLFVRSRVIKKYNKTKSIEKALYIESILGKYIHTILIIGTAFFDALVITPYFRHFHKFSVIIVVGVICSIITIILVINQLVLFNTNKMLRKTEATKKEQIGLLIRFMIFSIIPVLIMLAVLQINPKELNIGVRFQKYFKILIPVIAYMLISFILPLFNKYLLKAVPMDDSDLKNELIHFLNKCGIKKVEIFLWPMKSNKHANALVSGLIHKQIFISDYLLENFSLEETKAILAHEIGHIKKFHLWIRTALIIGMLIVFPLLGELFEYYEKTISEIPIWLGIMIFAIVFILYFGFFLYFIYRIQERQADSFVLELGVDGEVFISALYKLAKLNHTVMKYNKVDEKFKTHPSVAKRIKWIRDYPRGVNFSRK